MIARLIDLGRASLAAAGVAVGDIPAVGIGCGGPLDPRTGVIHDLAQPPGLARRAAHGDGVGRLRPSRLRRQRRDRRRARRVALGRRPGAHRPRVSHDLDGHRRGCHRGWRPAARAQRQRRGARPPERPLRRLALPVRTPRLSRGIRVGHEHRPPGTRGARRPRRRLDAARPPRCTGDDHRPRCRRGRGARRSARRGGLGCDDRGPGRARRLVPRRLRPGGGDPRWRRHARRRTAPPARRGARAPGGDDAHARHADRPRRARRPARRPGRGRGRAGTSRAGPPGAAKEPRPDDRPKDHRPGRSADAPSDIVLGIREHCSSSRPPSSSRHRSPPTPRTSSARSRPAARSSRSATAGARPTRSTSPRSSSAAIGASAAAGGAVALDRPVGR